MPPALRKHAASHDDCPAGPASLEAGFPCPVAPERREANPFNAARPVCFMIPAHGRTIRGRRGEQVCFRRGI